jgi:ESCRT-I complex subunit VPS28
MSLDADLFFVLFGCYLLTGVPATVIHGGSKDDRSHTVIVAETVQAFITTMDALRLGQRAVDEIQPLVSDVMRFLVKVPNLPGDFEGVVKMRLWLQKLHDMRAHDEIEEQESRQLLFEVESSYTAFHNFLKSG